MKRSLFTLVFLVCALSATAESLTISPAVVTLRGTAGQSTTQKLTLANDTSHEFLFEMIAQDVVVRNGERVFVPAGQIPGSIAATAVMSEPRVTIAPKTSASVTVTLTIPVDATHRGVVVIFRSVQAVTMNKVPVLASMGALFTFTITETYGIEADAPVVMPQSATQNLRLQQEWRNSGSEPYVARGAAVILDATGALVGRLDFESRRLLPGEKTTAVGEYVAELQPGRYTVAISVDGESRTTTTTAEILVP